MATPQAPNHVKQLRRNRQQATWAAIAELPADHQPAALLRAWPQRLPQWLWAELPSELKEHWQHLRMEASFNLSADHQVSLMVGALMERHAPAIAELQAALMTLEGYKEITVWFPNLAEHLSAPIPEGETERPAPEATCVEVQVGAGETSFPEEVHAGMAVAFATFGSVLLCQELTKRVYREDAQGVMGWHPQVCFYGVNLMDGQWSSMTAHEVREACSHGDNDTIPAGVSFGDLSMPGIQMAGRPH